MVLILVIGLRQAPPQRVLFQPDLTPARAPRQSSANAGSPQPTSQPSHTPLNSSSNPNSNSFTVANYEPRSQVPLTLRPVVTPGNNPNLFKERQRMLKDARAAKESKPTANYKGLMLPGSRFHSVWPPTHFANLYQLVSRVRTSTCALCKPSDLEYLPSKTTPCFTSSKSPTSVAISSASMPFPV